MRTGFVNNPPEYYHQIYSQRAKGSGMVFDLSFKLFCKYLKSKCFFCCKPVYRNSVQSLVRIDPNGPFDKTNMVPACKACATLKAYHNNYVIEQYHKMHLKIKKFLKK